MSSSATRFGFGGLFELPVEIDGVRNYGLIVPETADTDNVLCLKATADIHGLWANGDDITPSHLRDLFPTAVDEWSLKQCELQATVWSTQGVVWERFLTQDDVPARARDIIAAVTAANVFPRLKCLYDRESDEYLVLGIPPRRPDFSRQSFVVCQWGKHARKIAELVGMPVPPPEPEPKPAPARFKRLTRAGLIAVIVLLLGCAGYAAVDRDGPYDRPTMSSSIVRAAILGNALHESGQMAANKPGTFDNQSLAEYARKWSDSKARQQRTVEWGMLQMPAEQRPNMFAVTAWELGNIMLVVLALVSIFGLIAALSAAVCVLLWLFATRILRL